MFRGSKLNTKLHTKISKLLSEMPLLLLNLFSHQALTEINDTVFSNKTMAITVPHGLKYFVLFQGRPFGMYFTTIHCFN